VELPSRQVKTVWAQPNTAEDRPVFDRMWFEVRRIHGSEGGLVLALRKAPAIRV
jgi:hypothetical protein